MKAKTSAPNPQDSGKPAPLLVKKGNVTVKIYTIQNKVGDKTYLQYSVCYYDSAGNRVRKKFGDFDKAKGEAAFQALKLSQGETEALKLNSLDRAAYVEATKALTPLNLPLTVAIQDYVSATSRLPAGITLKQAVDFFISRNPAGMPKKTVQEAVDEIIAIKTKAGKSDVHLKDLTSRLGAFATAAQMNISDVSGSTIEAYLDAMEATGRTKLNHFRHIRTLFRFCVRRKYLSKEALEEIEAVEKPKEDLTDIQIFSPEEIRVALDTVRPELVPWLAIGAFAGLRSAELQRLDWSKVNLKERHIEVTAAIAKTASRRLVPITDNLAAWLADHAKESGPVTPFDNMAKQIGWLVDDVNEVLRTSKNPALKKFEWKRNALRHSFISYRLAVLKDVAQVSLDAGNSPNMVFRHYRQLVTENEGKKWFDTNPPVKESNIIPMVAVIPLASEG